MSLRTIINNILEINPQYEKSSVTLLMIFCSKTIIFRNMIHQILPGISMIQLSSPHGRL